ncbi:vWA domain-containing protein [Streptomyces sp. SAJ15]|uniref:vWA domain-containing protein n=1 Tax=Streptomyces sp. SAJ15 TaxID=2011095 RepID=UPI001643637B|nr:vWA domain-containing protein [Streptomyces sp. SAJ15]
MICPDIRPSGRRSRPRRRPARRALAATAAVCALAVGLAPAPPAAARETASDGAVKPIDFAVLVDVSDSLSDADLARETDAAALIAQAEISDRSRATVIGFGSAEKPGQQPVREVCSPTVTDEAGRQRLSRCAQQLKDRAGNRVGPGTDFPAALTQAVDRLGEHGSDTTPKVVFLLTDGKLDVADSPAYGTDPASRRANAAKKLRETLDRARREQVQIWPLGFGDGIDRDALRAMAAGGYRNDCPDRPGSTPRMRVADSATEVDRALHVTFAAARCGDVEEGTSARPPGELKVTIPPIATDGSITVTKHDPRVTVTYYDPEDNRVPAHGTAHGSRFDVSGQDGPVEALRVRDPLPGTWRVKLSAPEGHRDHPATVRAIWQGVLHSAISLEPVTPRPGERSVVRVRMQTRRGVAITDPEQLAGVKVTARLTGDGFAEPVDMTLRDDGEGPDERADDALYAAEFTVPETASGVLRIIGEMAAPGVTSDHRPYDTHTAPPDGPRVVADVALDKQSVYPGGEVGGRMTVHNDDTRPHTLRLALKDLPEKSSLRIAPTTVTVEAGAQRRVPFTVAFGADTALGDIGGQISVVDTTDNGQEVGHAFLTVAVEPEPSRWERWWDRWWWAAVSGGALALAAGALVAARVHSARSRKSLQGLVIEVRREGSGAAPAQLPVRGAGVRTFYFTVDGGSGSGTPTLRRRDSGGGQTYRLWRAGDGSLRLRAPRGREQLLPRGGPLALDDGLELCVRDERGATRGTARGGGGGGGGGRTAGGRGSRLDARPGGRRPFGGRSRGRSGSGTGDGAGGGTGGPDGSATNGRSDGGRVRGGRPRGGTGGAASPSGGTGGYDAAF